LLDPKQVAARKAVKAVKDGMTIGIGTGSTAAFAIQAIGERIKSEGLHVRAVATSSRSREMAAEWGIPLIDLCEVEALDLTIDGADQVGPNLSLIKGGGGALLREKIVAQASRELIIICDETKRHTPFGQHPLPVAVVPFGHTLTRRRLERFCQKVLLRPKAPDSPEPYLTDDGLYIYDMHMEAIADPPQLEQRLKQIVGVVEVGLFNGLASRVLFGFHDGHVEELLPDHSAHL
jgi:ribose 5-phosphate isomerase A